MALIDKVPRVISFIDAEINRIRLAKQKLDIYEGELLPFVEAALANELSPSAYERARKRIAPINFLTKTVNKVSTLYNNTVTRQLVEQNENNQGILDYYVKQFNLDVSGTDSSQQLNLNKYTAWEMYINSGNTPMLRTMPGHQFLVYSDDIEDPTNPTVFIKILGSFNKETQEIDEQTNQFKYKEVNIYKLYDNENIIVVDSDGELRPEFMKQNPEGVNPYGVIPFVYIRKAKHTLLPTEDTSDLPMTVLIPLLLTDLNYATQFMSHSIIYAIDADIDNLNGNPDSIWLIKSDTSADGETNANAKIGTIKPEVDIDKVITLIQTQLALWLDSKDIKAQGVGNLESSNLASGISKMIDEADTTQAIKSQIPIYQSAEHEMFLKMTNIHNTWVDQGLLIDTDVNRRVVGTLETLTMFEEPQVVVNEQDRIDTIKAKEDAGYITHKRAVQEANPDLSDTEIDALISELEQEQENKATLTILTEDNQEEDDGNNQEKEDIQEEE